VAAITWFPITRGWPYTAPSSSACPDHCRRRHLRGDTGPRVVVMVGRPIGRTDTDQKVGGSNPSGRALQIRCTAAVSAVSGDLGTRSHPINRPIEFGRGPLTHCDSVGVSIVVRTVALMRDARGGGSLRQRRPGVREVRVAVGPDPVSGRSRYRSLTVRGDRESAQEARQRWAAKAELVRSSGRTRPGITLAALLREWQCADHGWRPSTVAGYRSVAGFLTQYPVGSRRAVDLTPKVLAAACADWRSQGWPDPTVWARMRVLRSALGWAYTERILDVHPLDGRRSPPHAAVRMHAPVDHVRATHAEIEHQIGRLRRLLDGLDPQTTEPEDIIELRRLLYGLYAVLRLHNAQEEEGAFSLVPDGAAAPTT